MTEIHGSMPLNSLSHIFVQKGSIIPQYKTKGSAGADICVRYDTVLHGGRNLVPTGLHMQFPNSYQALVEARSGFSARGMEAMPLWAYRLNRLFSTDWFDRFTRRIDADVLTGKIDSDYRGEIKVIVKSHTIQPYVILGGTRIAQLTFVPVSQVRFVEVFHLTDTDRGDGGIGHTGTR